MKKNFHLDELEAFLSDSADQQRMYPSDRVWRNIDKELHGQKKWPALTFGALLTGAIITAGLILIHPDKNLLQIDPGHQVTSSQKQTTFSTNNTKQELTSIATNDISSNAISGNKQLLEFHNTVPYSDAFSYNNHNQNLGSENAGNDIAVTDGINDGWNENRSFTDALPSSAIELLPNAGLTFEPSLTIKSDLDVWAADIIQNKAAIANSALTEQTSNDPIQLSKNINSNKWGVEYYFAPSFSYRYLTESKIVDFHQNQQAGPIAPNLINPVDNFVNHKPTLGLEAGAGIAYQATDKLRLSAGLQLNMRGYSIEAFASGVEPSTIVLNRGYYTDSIFALSSYSTQSGYSDVEIMNRYWQVAIPIGMQYKVTNGKKLNLSIAASIQPTYQINNSEYILSNDYRNYLQQPDLVKRWNLNTAIGAVISYQAAGINWQVGPQIRYQVGSGTIKEYPIKEHLIDYGLRIGVVKTLK